jgi:NAD dependent epimerase/dehydratase family enzyme
MPDSCHTFVCASATWYYPATSGEVFDVDYINNSPQNFLEKLCIEREKEAAKASTKSRRVIHLRSGLVTGSGTFEQKLQQSTKWFGGVVLW